MFFDMWDNLQQVRQEWKPWYARNKREIRKRLNLWRPNWKRKILWIIGFSLPAGLAFSFLTKIGVAPFSHQTVSGVNKSIQHAAMVIFSYGGFAAIWATFHLVWYGLLYKVGQMVTGSRDIDARARHTGEDVIARENKEIRAVWITTVLGVLAIFASGLWAGLNILELKGNDIKLLVVLLSLFSLFFIFPTTLLRHIDILRTGIPIQLLKLATETERVPYGYNKIDDRPGTYDIRSPWYFFD